ncbi:MAG: hypothetical protein WCX95_05445, partial [Candidatus Gracilibacteria bacterium]
MNAIVYNGSKVIKFLGLMIFCFLAFISLNANLAYGASYNDYSTEDFETTTNFPSMWTSTSPWTRASDYAQEGTYSVKASVSSYGNIRMSLTLTNMPAGQLTYYVKMQSPGTVYTMIDSSGSGTTNAYEWTKVTNNISAGTHTFEWSFYSNVYESNPIWVDNIKFSAAIETPTEQTYDITIADPSPTYDKYTNGHISWTNGNGNHRLIVMKEGSTGTFTPVDGTNYSSSHSFSNGTDLGDGWRAIHNTYSDGTYSNSFNISGLTPGTNYIVQSFEYNKGIDNSSIKYFTNTATNNPATYTTPAVVTPSVQSYDLTFTSVGYNRMTANWTSGTTGDGYGEHKLVLMKQASLSDSFTPIDGTTYSSNSTFGSGTSPGDGWYTVYNGSGSSIAITGLTAETNYLVQVFEYNGPAGYEDYLTTAGTSNNPSSQATIAPTQSSNITFSNVTHNQMDIAWTNGNSDRRVAFMKEASTSANAIPVDGNSYYASTSFSQYSKGSQIGSSGWYTIYNSTGTAGATTTVTVTDLDPESNYIVQVFEYEYSSPDYSYDYFTDLTGLNNPSAAQITGTPSEPTLQTSGLSISSTDYASMGIQWTYPTDPANGDGRIIFMKEATSSTDAAPVDTTDYDTSSTFGSGDPIGSTGWYAVYETTSDYSNSVWVYGLKPGTSYLIQSFEYNGPSGYKNYLTTVASGNSITNVTTAYVAPTTPASSLSLSNSGYDMNISWSSGNGGSRAVFMKKAGEGTAAPSNHEYYTANTAFGSGEEIAPSTGWYTVYNSSYSSVTVTNLEPNVTYIVQVFEYNGSSGYEEYLLTDAPSSTLLTTAVDVPTTQASSVTLSSGIADATVTWTRGEEDKAIVFLKQATATDTDAPADL